MNVNKIGALVYLLLFCITFIMFIVAIFQQNKFATILSAFIMIVSFIMTNITVNEFAKQNKEVKRK